jgi:hypothetical protein
LQINRNALAREKKTAVKGAPRKMFATMAVLRPTVEKKYVKVWYDDGKKNVMKLRKNSAYARK